MTVAYQIKNDTDLSKIAILPELLRLMMSRDAVASAMRWTTRLQDTDSPEDDTDRLMAMITAMGWVGETICLIRTGNSAGWIVREMIANDAALLETWNECTARKPNPAIALAHRIRGRCFGHWDRKVAVALIENLVNREPGIGPTAFIESDEGGTQGKTRFPWVCLAIGTEVFGDTEDKERIARTIGELTGLMKSVNNLVAGLILAIIQENRIEFEPFEKLVDGE